MLKQLQKLGPGLLYAGAAVGVSHLVQSTRAGANYGMWMIAVVVLANVLKYPFFKAAPLFTVHTGHTLLEEFHRKGKLPMLLFYGLTFTTMFTVQAVVTLITASICASLFELTVPLWAIGAALLFICSLILLMGHYQWLNRTMKMVIVLLTITSVVTLLAAILQHQPSTIGLKTFSFFEDTDIFFLIALVGWMPAPLDIALWHSEWAHEEKKHEGQTFSIQQANVDFKIGYWGTTFLAAVFVAMGALLLQGNGAELPTGGAAFASELIGMYTSTLGSWSFIFVAIAAIATMFSTTLTVLDAYPRVMSKAMKLSFPRRKGLQSYFLWLMITGFGAIFVLIFQLENMKQLVDLATSISFITAPILAALILWVVLEGKQLILSKSELMLAWLGGAFLFGFALYFSYIRWVV